MFIFQDLHEVRLGRVEQVNERVRLFRLELVSGPIKVIKPMENFTLYNNIN